MAWKDRVKSYQERKAVDHTIDGLGTIKFFPNRMGQLEKLKSLSSVVLNSMATLFSDNRGDAEAVTETATDESGFTQQKTTVAAVSTEVLEYRASEQRKAIEELFDLADRRNLMLLGEMFMDSMRDEFVYAKQRAPQEVEEFLYGMDKDDADADQKRGDGAMDVTLFVDIVQGWMKANSKVFGDVGEKLVGLIRERLQSASLSVEEPTDDETGSTSGPGSKTASSQLAPTAGASSESKS